ncbi:hypothetical protein CP061683_0829A, partial [Chlamydia psittaci 06-1683]
MPSSLVNKIFNLLCIK